MMKKKAISLTKRLRSFAHASNGLKILLMSEPNARIHSSAAIAVVVMGFYFKISSIEWIVILLCIGLVMSLEAINTAIEKLSDIVSMERKPEIKAVKDLSAGGVLIAAIVSSLVGIIIFSPKILDSLWP